MVGLVVNTIGLVAEDEGHDAEAELLYREALDTAVTLDAATESAYAASRPRCAAGADRSRRRSRSPVAPAAGAWAEHRNALLRAKSEAHLGLALLAAGGPVEEATAIADAGLAMVRAGPPAGRAAAGLALGAHPAAPAAGPPGGRCRRARRRRGPSSIGRPSPSRTPDLRRQFFERVPVNRAIVRGPRSERLAGRPRRSVELARHDAPLGRTLRDDERVVVRWTLHAPDDDAIADKGARRRHRLVRLIEEAAAAGAAPTDDDLAAALGVSRRTILRDIELLAASPALSQTRRRARQGQVRRL